jgi:putative phage-type endonuclease
MIVQGTDEWFAQRLGKVTASKVSDVMAKTRSGYSASRTNYMMQLLCERLTGKREETYTNAAMQRGTDCEPLARSVYEAENGCFVVETGMIVHPHINQFGASPDGLVSDDGLLEIKCPNTATHIDFLRTGKPDNKYQWQMLAQMSCSGRAWCDFVSFDDRLPAQLQYSSVRFMRDDARISEMENEIMIFLSELDKIETEMKTKIGMI